MHKLPSVVLNRSTPKHFHTQEAVVSIPPFFISSCDSSRPQHSILDTLFQASGQHPVKDHCTAHVKLRNSHFCHSFFCRSFQKIKAFPLSKPVLVFARPKYQNKTVLQNLLSSKIPSFQRPVPHVSYTLFEAFSPFLTFQLHHIPQARIQTSQTPADCRHLPTSHALPLRFNSRAPLIFSSYPSQ